MKKELGLALKIEFERVALTGSSDKFTGSVLPLPNCGPLHVMPVFLGVPGDLADPIVFGYSGFMQQLQRFSFAILLLCTAGLGNNDAAAQQLYVSTSGKIVPTTGPNAITDNAGLRGHCNNPANPCSLAQVLANDGLGNDTLAVMVSGAGATVNLSSDLTVADELSFRFYLNDSAPSVSHAGTLKISGNLTLSSGGVIKDHGDKLAIVVTSPQLNITANQTGSGNPGPNLPGSVTIGEAGRLVRIEQSGTDECMTFDDLTLAGRTQMSPTECDNGIDAEAVIVITSSLTVNEPLQLQESAILSMEADVAAKDRDKSFLAVNSARGIDSFGGTLRVAVSGYDEPAFDAVKDSDVYKDKKCFQVRGTGPIAMDLEVTTAQFVCVSVPSIGAGGTSTIHAGTVQLSSTTVNGNLRNRGPARTDVLAGLTISGDLVIDGRWVNAADRAIQGNPIFSAASDGILTPTEYTPLLDAGQLLGGELLDAPIVAIDSVGWGTAARTNIAACTLARRPGVHLGQGVMIDGELTMSNIAEQHAPDYQTPSPTNQTTPVEAGKYAVPCQSGLFLEGNGMTTVKGIFKAQELDSQSDQPVVNDNDVHTLGGFVHLGGKYHNLVLEGDVDISGTHTVIDMGKAADASTSINACSMGMADSGAEGNKVILGGSAYQNVELSTDVDHDGNTATPLFDRTLMLDALTINKSGGGAEFSQGSAGVAVKYLESLNGMLSTGSAISGGALLGFQPDGTIAFTGGTGTVANAGTGGAYVTGAGPSSVVYASGSHEIGAERGGAGNITILSDGVITIKGKGGKITDLNLYIGTLKVTDELEVSGTIEMGNTGKFDLSEGSLKHTGNNLTYAGNMVRSAGMALVADSAMAEKVTDLRTVTVNQACDGAVGLEVDLNAGYTSLGGFLNVTKGALDLNGGGLVLQDHIDGNAGRAQALTIYEHGMICDTHGGVACSDSEALEEDLQKGDELFAALEDIRVDFSEETQAALDKAVDAYTSTNAKTSTHGKGIIVGYVEKDHAPSTAIEIVKKDKMLPMVTTMGGKVTLGSDDSKSTITLAGLSVDGGKTSEVLANINLGRLAVLGDVSVASGRLTLFSPETVIAGAHTQTGGEVNADDTKHSVMGAFTVTGGKYTQGADGILSLAGDVTVSSASAFAGKTELIGTKTAQILSASQDLGDVTVNAGAGVVLAGDVSQGASADLTLQRGHITTGDHVWMIKNKAIEQDLAMRTAVPTNATGDDPATIFLGNRASFVDGAVSRKVAHGNSGLGNEKGGYLFPVGMLSETRNRYRPLILNFATDVSPNEVVVTTSGYAGNVTWPSAGITTASTSGGTYTLDTYAPIMWKVEFSRIPALGATVRVAADGLVGVNDSNGLRLVQWDCDGTNVRLAGEFDLAASGVDASSVSANGRINGVPNTTMAGVDAAECSIIGIAANYAENPIGEAPPAATPMANVQLIHNIVGATVDVYVDDILVADNFAFQTATSLSTQITPGQHMVHVRPATAQDNSTPIASIPVSLDANGMYTVVANGDLTNFNFALLANTRSESVADDKVEFRVVHGAASLGEVDLRSLTEAGRWANNLSFNEATGYRTAEAIVHNVELLDGHSQIDVFELDLGDYINQTLVLALSGTGTSSAMGLTLMGVATDGSVFFPQVVTSAETDELPTEFALQGNYPNPFNPSTQIQFDLPSTADVEIQVIDLLGRTVLSLPSRRLEAGANQTVELDGSALASGTYLYRLIANMDSGIQVETGRLVLIK